MAITHFPAQTDPAAKPIMEMVNGTFWATAASSPCFWRKVASIDRLNREF
jgi:hypothetical protein